MFIKIKLEPQRLRPLANLKITSYFRIDDDATIIDLKNKIEEYVDVPAERQEVRTLFKTFENHCKIHEVCDPRGSALMLYAYDETYEQREPQFICFLQVFTNEMAARQQEFEQSSKLQTNSKESTPTSSSSSVTLIAVSDSEESDGTNTDASSSKASDSDSESSSSGSSSDNSDSSAGGKKRNKHAKSSAQQKKLKVIASTGGEYSPTLCKYLDDYPKHSTPLNTSEDTAVNKTVIQSTSSKPNEIKQSNTIANISPVNKDSTEVNKQNNIDNPPVEKMTSSDNSISYYNKIQSNIISTTNKNNNNIHPCYAINPEIREYVVIISKTDKTDINNSECQELLMWFFDRFRACDSSNKLQFDSQTAVSLHEGKLWIACMDENTSVWITSSISEYNLKPYTILSLKESSEHICEVVLPIVSDSKNILDIFDLLEKQNENLTTLKWCIKSRKTLLFEEKDFNEKAVSTFCTNEVFQIIMDKESKNLLEKQNLKLKYCFWQIVFQFI